MRKIGKRGQTLELVGGTIIGFMVLIFLIFAVLYAVSTLNPEGFFSAGSLEANATGHLTKNLTTGVGTFAGYIPTILTILAVVLVLAGIVILILYVKRMQGSAGAGGGAL